MLSAEKGLVGSVVHGGAAGGCIAALPIVARWMLMLLAAAISDGAFRQRAVVGFYSGGHSRCPQHQSCHGG